MQNFLSEENLKNMAPIILKLGIVFVFFYFGINQILHPTEWTAFLPTWVNTLPVTPLNFITFNGAFEIVSASLLLLGIFTRWVALILSIHLFIIAFSMGLNDISVRDIGLAIATLCIALLGVEKISLENIKK